MSYSSSPTNPSYIGAVDLESVLNVRRRTLASIDEAVLPRQQHRCTDTIYMKRIDKDSSVYSIDSKIVIFGDLQFLCSLFERYTVNIIVNEGTNSNKTNPSANSQDNENTSDISSTIRRMSISAMPKSREINLPGRSETFSLSIADYSMPNLDGKHYGSIEVPNMNIIEILEVFLRNGLEIVNVSSYCDNNHFRHQNFVLSKVHRTLQKHGATHYS